MASRVVLDDSHRLCRKCLLTKPASEFPKSPTCRGGRRLTCRVCGYNEPSQEQREIKRRRSKAWGRDNCVVARKRAAKWRLDNPVRHAANQLRWSQENKSRRQASDLSWRLANRTRKAATDRAWVQRNKSRIAANTREYRAKNPDKAALFQFNRKARKKAGGGTITLADVKNIKHQQRGRCAMCTIKLGSSFHRDHIVPLAKGGPHIRSNIQLLCARCNVRKGVKDPILFAQELGLLL